MATAKLQGGDELIEKLKKLDYAVRGQIISTAVMAGANLVRASAEQKAPVHMGRLKRNIIAELQQQESFLTSFVVGPAATAWYGRFPEFGTRFMAARPFLRPAFDEQKQAVKKVIGECIRAGLESAVRL